MISISIVQCMNYKQIPFTQKSKGFTVVEVIVAVVLFSMVVVMLVSIVGVIQYSQRQSIYANIANRAAQSKIAEYQRGGYAAYSAGHFEEFASDDMIKGLPSGRAATILVSQPVLARGSKELEVTITYPAGGTTKTVRAKAYLTEGGGA